jgi:DNA-binding response OmpR family regulator
LARILVVDDEPTLVATLRFNLQKEGHQVLTAEDGERAVALAREAQPDLVILDLMLRRMSGFDVCRVIRAESAIPIIILSARSDETDRVVGLEIGADDYVTKPFSMRELLARIRVRLRPPDASHAADEILTCGNIAVEVGRRRATIDGHPLPLKPMEFDLLAYLIRNRGRVLTRAQILQSVWRYGAHEETRTVDVHIGRLRAKIEDTPAQPTRILTIRGRGYVFVA